MKRFVAVLSIACLTLAIVAASVAVGAASESRDVSYSISAGPRGGIAEVEMKFFPETCSGRHVEPNPATVHVGPLTLRNRDLCEDEWKVSGRIPFLGIWKSGYGEPEIDFNAEYSGKRLKSRTYPVTIVLGGRAIHRRLTLTTGATKIRLVYEGSDAFVNYCIDGNHEIRSENHRLYCEAGGHDLGHVVITN